MANTTNNTSNDERLYQYFDESGERIGVGFLPSSTDPNSMVGKNVSPSSSDQSLWELSNPYKAKASISLNTETGNIKISAPKSITDTEEFKRVFDEDTLKAYSQAYKMNKDYKVKVEEVNKDTGEVEEKEVTIPEWIKNRDSALKSYMASLEYADKKRDMLVSKYGEKAKNMTPSYITMSEQSDKYTYLPEILKGVSVFGDDPNKRNAFKQLLGKVGENGELSAEDLKEVYTRGNFGRTELAGVIATIDGALRGSDWSKDEYYTDEETGEKIYNTASAKEAAKLLAFRDFLTSHHPEGNWFEEIGGNIETLSLNALYGADRVFLNIANLGEMVFTLGQGKAVQTLTKDIDKTVGQYNQDQALTSDATTLMATVGYIGGTIAGTILSGKVAKNIIGDIKEIAGAGAGKILQKAATTSGITSPAELMADIAKNPETYSLGARMVLNFATAKEKVSIATSLYKAFMSEHSLLDFATSVAVDTFHDALLYDATTLRDVLSNSSGNVADFWLGQFVDNTKWWTGMAIGKGVVKLTTKTPLGAAANIGLTKVVNRVAAKIGGAKAEIKDKVHGGSIVDNLEKKIKEASDKGHKRTENRLKKQLEQERWNLEVRKAREELGNLSLEWDGIKLSEDSYEEYKNAITKLKATEVSIDRYHRNIEYQRQLMVGAQYNPATGKVSFINPTLGNANLKATKFYTGMTELAKKYNLPLADKSLISQDMIDYWMGRYTERLANKFAENSTDTGKRAKEALPILESNNAVLRDRLPKEITNYIDNGIKNKLYQQWYSAQNEYGMAKGLLNRVKVSSYENNPIWQDAGYMPIVVELPESRYRMVDVEGRLNAKIDDDFEKIEFKVSEGQHYVDPELTRQNRLSEMAQIEVNNEIFKAYAGFGSNATNVVKISGEETEYVRQVTESKKYLENAVAQISVEKIKNLDIPIVKVRSRRPITYTAVSEKDVTTIVSSMSPTEVTEYLVRNGELKTGETIVGNLNADNYSDWYNAQSKSTKKFLVQQYNDRGINIRNAGDAKYFENFKMVAKEGGADFEASLERSTLIASEKFAKSPLANEARHNLEMGREAFYQGVVVADVKSHLRNVKNVDVSPLVDDLVVDFNSYVDDFTKAVLDNEGAKTAINALSETSDASYEFGKYIALRRLQESGLRDAHSQIDKRIDAAVSKLKGIDANDVKVIKNQAHTLFDDIVDSNLNDVSDSVRAINPDLVDTKYIYAKADDLNKEITKIDKEIKTGDDTRMVMYLDDNGRQVFAEVDPAFASLFNYRYKMDKVDASALAKINAVTSKVFRYGTTSVNLKSFGNQLFRDFGNALFIGGSWHTIKYYRNDLVDVFGQNIVDQIGRFDPTGYEMKQLQQLAESTGESLQQAAVSRELMRGAAISPTTTERTLYKEFTKDIFNKKNSDLTLRDMRNKFQKVVDKFDVDDYLNGKRENYLRNRVFASSLDDAMKAGYNLEQSRVFAEFAMNNATTNFSRQVYHLQAIADSTPYFRAAINGTKSFWRMWSLDPVGISGRITGGLIIPVIYLTGASLGSEENRKVYESIPEYQKEGSLVFVMNGQIISAPMPQELAPIVAPVRQFVEYLYGTNKNDFWELMMNDALGFFPYDFQGFSTIDMDKMISDPTIFDRINRGVARVFSQMAPIPLKSTYMLATGTDPYTGKNLRNPEYSFWNEETNSVETMDYYQNSFAKAVASIPWLKDWVTPALADKVISGTIGVTNSHLLGDLTALVTKGGEAALGETMENIGSQLGGPFTIEQYDQIDATWKRAVRELTAEKESILNSDEMKVINNKLSQEKDPEKRKALLSARQNLVNDFQERVGDTVKRLESVYSGTFDQGKFSAVIQLLNFNTNTPYQNASQYSSDLASSMYYEGRDSAIHTMQMLGIDGTHDTSVFGYLTKDKDGNIAMRYSNPVAILDMTNTWNNQKDYHLANVKAIASQNDLWDKKKAVDEQVDAIYAKSKLKDSDYDAIDAIYVNWNAEVMSALAPYVSEMTPEAAINNQQVLNYLAGLIKVPGEYKKDKYGKYVSSSKLGEGSATDAYIKSYIKNIFRVNDTGYSGGSNYSTRKNYDKENKRWT